MGNKDDKDERIDLTKLTQRELLILLCKDVQEMKQEIKGIMEREQQMALKLNSLEVKSKVWGAVVGFFAGLVSGIITK